MSKFQLHVWGGAFGLESIDVECLAAIKYCSQVFGRAGLDDQWEIIPSSDPSICPSRTRLPVPPFFDVLRDALTEVSSQTSSRPSSTTAPGQPATAPSQPTSPAISPSPPALPSSAPPPSPTQPTSPRASPPSSTSPSMPPRPTGPPPPVPPTAPFCASPSPGPSRPPSALRPSGA